MATEEVPRRTSSRVQQKKEGIEPGTPPRRAPAGSILNELDHDDDDEEDDGEDDEEYDEEGAPRTADASGRRVRHHSSAM